MAEVAIARPFRAGDSSVAEDIPEVGDGGGYLRGHRCGGGTDGETGDCSRRFIAAARTLHRADRCGVAGAPTATLLSYCLVAEGAVDIAAQPEVSVGDLAALDMLVREAGGKLSGLDP